MAAWHSLSPPSLLPRYASSSRVPWRPLQLDDIAFRIADVERWSLALGAIARARLANLDSLRRQIGTDLCLVIAVKRDAEMIEVAPFLARRGATHSAKLAVDRHEIDQGLSGAHLRQSDLGLLALHRATEDIAVEPHHAVAVAHPQD